MLPGQKLEERAVAAETWVTAPAPGKVRTYRPGLFRTQLLVQIFPEENYNFLTVHSAPTDVLIQRSLLNSGIRRPVPDPCR